MTGMLSRTKAPFLFGALSLSLLLAACGDTEPVGPQSASVDGAARTAGGGAVRNMVVELRGTAVGETRTIDGVPMMCFDVDVYDPGTGRRIGRGTDCLDLGSIAGGDPAVEGFAISNTTFFRLREGTVVSRNRTTIQPVIEGSPGMTHTTGDMPGAENVLHGDGAFDGVRGTARLSLS